MLPSQIPLPFVTKHKTENAQCKNALYFLADVYYYVHVALVVAALFVSTQRPWQLLVTVPDVRQACTPSSRKQKSNCIRENHIWTETHMTQIRGGDQSGW